MSGLGYKKFKDNGPRPKSVPSQAPNVILGLLGLAVVAALAIGIAGLVVARTRGPHHDPSQIHNLNVTGNLTAVKAIIDAIMGGNVSVGDTLTSANLLVQNEAVIALLNANHVNVTEVLTAKEIATDMLSFAPIVINADGEMPVTHNTFHLFGSAALNVSLPSDMTPLVGKRLHICNADGKQHTISASPNFWDTNDLWSVMRFQNGKQCCVEATVLTATRIHITSGINKECALLCQGQLCVDPSDPEGSNPLFGQWMAQTQSIGIRESMIELTLDGNQVRITRRSGSPFTFIREKSLAEQVYAPQSPVTETVTMESEVSFSVFSQAGYLVFQEPDSSEVFDIRDIFTLQADGVSLVRNFDKILAEYYPSVLFKKVSGVKVVGANTDFTFAIDSPDGTPTGYNVNSIVNQFNELVEIIRTMFVPSFAPFFESSVYPGIQESRRQQNQALTTGYGPYVTNLADVWTSYLTDGTRLPHTSIFTDSFSNAAAFARVAIAGLGTGTDSSSPFTVLNGNHRAIVGSDRSCQWADITAIYSNNHYNATRHRHMFNIDVDTTAIRLSGRQYNPIVDGAATVTVTFEPITENMSPSDYFATFNRWLINQVYGIHTYGNAYVRPDGRGYETFDELHAAQQAFDFGTEYLDTRFVVPVMEGSARSTAAEFRSYIANEPFDAQPNFGPNYYHTPHENYMSEINQVYYAVDPNTSSDPAKLTGQMVSRGFNANGSRFMFTYAPIGSTPTFPYPGAPQAANGTVWTLVESQFSGRFLSFGLVNPAYTTETTAYFFIPDEVEGPYEMFSDLFAPDGTQGYANLKSTFADASVFVQMFAVVFERVATYNADKIILDTRTNQGGFIPQTLGLATFIGDDRSSIYTDLYSRDVGTGATVYREQDWVAAGYPTLGAQFLVTSRINVTHVIQEYGASRVFQGVGKRVVVLTSFTSGSGGDTLPWFFVGDNPMDNRNLGAGVTSAIVGNIDGRLDGTAHTIPLLSTTSKDTISSFYGFPDGYIQVNVDVIATVGKPPYPSMVNQHPVTEPDLLLSSYAGDTYWLDEGHVTPYPDAPLPGWTGAGGVQEITSVTCLSGGALTQSGSFNISSPATDYYVWYNIDASGVDPAPAGRTGIEVAVLSGDSAAQVTIKTVNAMGPNTDWWIEFTSATAFTVRNKLAQLATIAGDVDSGNTVTQVQASATGVVGQPLLSDQSTWRDRWLEAAIKF